MNWVDAGKVELEQGSSYFGLGLPFDITTLTVLEVLLVGGVEVLRSGELDQEKRIYPGGPFDPLGFAGPDKDEEKTFGLKVAEIKHGRLAMVAFFGYGVQAGTTGTGSIITNLTRRAPPLFDPTYHMAAALRVTFSSPLVWAPH